MLFKCPGICIPQAMSSICGEMLPKYGCEEGTTCCKYNEDEDQEVKEEEKVKRKERPSNLPIQVKPDCPGTCIKSLLSFLCFSESGSCRLNVAAEVIDKYYILASSFGRYRGGHRPL